MTTTSPPEVQADNASLVRWFFERLNEHDLDSLRPFWTDQTVEHFPDRTACGADEIAAYFQQTFVALPDWKMEVIALAAQGEDVFVRWHLSGTHSGPLLGVEATGKQVHADGVDHFVFEHGKVASNTIFVDQMNYARQIGLLPLDGSPLEKAMKGAFNARTRLLKKIKR